MRKSIIIAALTTLVGVSALAITMNPPISTFTINGHTYTNQNWEANFQGTLAAVAADIVAVASSTGTSGVANNAELKALTAGTYSYMIRHGTITPGDGGYARYIWSSSNCTLNGGLGDDGAQVKPNAGTGCWIADIAGSRITPQLWAPNTGNNGSIDYSATMQKAVNFICGMNGGELYLPAGKYKFHDINITCDGFHLVGSGAGNPANSTGTSIDCTDTVIYCVRIGPTVVPSATRVVNGAIRNLSVVNTDYNNISRTHAVFQIDQVSIPVIESVWSSGAATLVKIYGSENAAVRDIFFENITNKVVEFYGDLQGMVEGSSTPGTCTYISCSTYSIALTMSNIFGSSEGEYGTLLEAHDFAHEIYGSQMEIRNGLYGIKTSCSPGKPTILYCPRAIILSQFSTSETVYPVTLRDFTDFKATSSHFRGKINTFRVIDSRFEHYAAFQGTGGGIKIMNSMIQLATGSCVYAGMHNLELIGNNIFGCNYGNSGGAGVQINSGTNHIISSNNFCAYNAYLQHTMKSYIIEVGATNAIIADNLFVACDAGVNQSSAPSSIRLDNNYP